VTGRLTLAVLGAINVDLVVSGAPLPKPGETVSGGTFSEHHGGKGGNQAVAAARSSSTGARLAGEPSLGVWMLGAVGDDGFGRSALEALRLNGVRTDHVLVSGDAPTGIALIAVDADGENQISVAAGANGALDPESVVGALEELEPQLVLASLEVPQAVAAAVLDWCRGHAVPTVLNPAPSHPWARDLAPLATYLTPNERELQALGDIPDDVAVIETRGADGALIHRGDTEDHVPAPRVNAVDTTGAGDCFNGVLAARLVLGHSLQDAVRDAVVAASISVGVSGAREGMPTTAAIAEARARVDG
jgi:ribokinase